MTKTTIHLDNGGLLIFTREGGRLVRVRYIDPAVAAYYMEVL
jgi:hypothetical protein